MKTLANFPPEVLLRIFSNLGYRDLVTVRRTCVQWRDLSLDEGLLRTIKQRDFSEDKWNDQKYCPSAEEIGLAVFLGKKPLKLIRYVVECVVTGRNNSNHIKKSKTIIYPSISMFSHSSEIWTSI